MLKSTGIDDQCSSTALSVHWLNKRLGCEVFGICQVFLLVASKLSAVLRICINFIGVFSVFPRRILPAENLEITRKNVSAQKDRSHVRRNVTETLLTNVMW